MGQPIGLNQSGVPNGNLAGTNGAAHVLLADPVTGLALGIRNSGVKVSNEYEPARDLFSSFSLGSETVLQTLTVSAANNGLWLDMSLIRPDARSLVIVNGSSGGAVDYAYTVQFSRNGLGVTTDDTYGVLTVAAGAKAQIVSVPLPASYGYDRYMRVVITPTTAQAGAQLTFKAYLIGRGG